MMNITCVLILFASCNVFQPLCAAGWRNKEALRFPPLTAEAFHPAVALFQNTVSEESSSASSDQPIPSTTEGKEPTDKNKLTPEQREDRKKMLPVIWLLLIGVAILGGILLLLVILFGSRVRRIARKPLPDAPVRDPMWYLKPNANDPCQMPEKPPETDHE